MTSIIVPIRFKPVGHDEKISSATQNLLSFIGSGLWPNFSEDDFSVTRIVSFLKPGSVEQIHFFEPIKKLLEENEGVQNVIFDFGGPNSDEKPLDLRLGLAFLNVIDFFHETQANIKFLACLPFRPEDEDPFSIFLKKRIKEAALSLFFYEDSSLQTHEINNEKTSDMAPDITQLLTLAKEKITDVLSRKFVCHLGYFSIENYDGKIFDYYDGSIASSEVYSCLHEIVSRLIGNKDKFCLLYDRLSSDWFTSAVGSLVSAFEGAVIAKPLDEVDFQCIDFEVDLLLFPIVRTGNAALKVVSSLRASNIDPPIWTILHASSEESGKEHQEHLVSCKDDSTKILINSLLQRGERAVSLVDAWSELDIPALPVSDLKLSDPFTSDSMWAMIFEAGIKKEENVPGREQIPWVPDFVKFVDNNSSLIAAKIDAVEKEHFPNAADRNVWYLIPSEPVPRMICRSLGELCDRPCIAVHSEIFDIARGFKSFLAFENALEQKIDSGRSDLKSSWELVRKYRSDQEVLRVNKEPQKQVIILNEFSYSGGTISGMYDFARLMEWEVLSSISLSKMRPEQDFTPDHSFYEFNYG